MKRQIWIGVLAAVLAVAILTIWKFLPSSQEEQSVIRIGYLSLASSLPFFVALENGYFEEEGLKVEAFRLSSSNEVADALLAKRIDATSISALSVWMAIEQHSPNTLKAFLMSYADAETTVHRFLVRSNSDIKTLSDLKGKTIGTFPGLQMHIFTKLILNQFFETTDLNLVPLSPPLQRDALVSGRVDALFCLEPVGTIVQEAGIGEPIAINPLYNFILKPFPTAASVVSSKFFEEHPTVTRKYIQAIYRAVDFIAARPNEARRQIPKYTSLDEKISQKVGIYDFWKADQIDRSAVEKLAELYEKHGILEGRVNTIEMYVQIPR